MVNSSKKPFSRLPTDVVPINYDLKLSPCLKKFDFDGEQKITVQVNKATTSLVMNCVDIQVGSVEFSSDTQTMNSTNINYDSKQETVTFTFPEAMKPGSGVVSMDFKGEINNKMKGLYRSKYMKDGEEKYCAVTQFESTDARRCFPCWDEPACKATFDATLVVPSDRVALSNMHVIEESEHPDNPEKKVLKYATTPIMSTYLLAFVVGEFDYIEESTKNDIKVRVYTPLGKTDQGKFALDVALKALDFYEEYFGISYPLSKMDLIAIADFTAGAMENWGLVTYRETALLIDNESSSAHTRQWVALVVCHELAHQWFGNLVTMEWWTHLWLNEGFASFMEYLAVDHCLPDYQIWTQFITHDLVRAFDLDALDNSHPIEIPVGHPDEIDEIFDAISYSKGASVIRMLYNWIGGEAFRSGLHEYLVKFSYKNAFTEDLWEYLGKASGKPVNQVMSTWTTQMGYPVLDVSLKSSTDNSVTLNISQKKYSPNPSSASGNYMWSVPINFSTSKNPTGVAKTFLLDSKSAEVTIEDVPSDGWVKVNPSCTGFYRVSYSNDLMDKLLPAVKNQQLPAIDRLNLQNDLFALALAGSASTVDYLRVLEAYSNETDYNVWSDINSKISTLSKLLWNDSDASAKFKQYTYNLFKQSYDTLGFDNKEEDDHLTSMLRSLVIGRMGACGNQEVLEESKRRFEFHLDGSKPLNADLRSPVYDNVLSHGGRDAYEKMLKLHDEADLHEERVRIEKSLGALKDPELINEVFQFALSNKVRDNDKVFVISSVATSHPLGREMAWNFSKENWDKLHEMYKGMFLISRLVKGITENFATTEKANEVQKFFKTHPAEAAERTIQQSVEQIRQKSAWWERDGKSIQEYLNQASA